MKLFHGFIVTIISVLSFEWAVLVYDYFFELTGADRIGLLFSLFVGLAFSIKIRSYLTTKNRWLILILVLPLPFLIYPMVSSLLLVTDLGWLVVHLFLMFSMAGAIFLFESRLLLLLPVVFSLVFFLPYDFKREQLKFYDRLQDSVETRFGSAQIVKWKNDFWLYYNQQLQFSTMDKHMYQEAYVQPAMQFIKEGGKILLIGGDNGVVEEELSKFENSVSLTVLAMDYEFHDFVQLNEYIPSRKFTNKKVVKNADVFNYLFQGDQEFDLIIIDTPDPVNAEFSQYYTLEFYQLCQKKLADSGLIITQSGDMYKNGSGTYKIWNSLESAGLTILPFHCQIPTIGQWSWVIGSRDRSTSEMRAHLENIRADKSTIWWNQEAMDMMLAFGKKNYFSDKTSQINSLVKLQGNKPEVL